MILDQIKTLPRTDLQLPASLEPLKNIALNMYWAWHEEALELFRTIDPTRFAAGLPSVALLRESVRLEQLALDEIFVARVNKVSEDMARYLSAPPKTWKGIDFDHPVAYFCAEFGLHEAYAQYSGGLGILAGDHCKEASDQHLPFIAVGCFYKLGFFRQNIDAAGRQEHAYPEFDFRDHPLERVANPADGAPLFIELDLPGRKLSVAVWRIAVGRVPLLLLDTNVPENSPEDRVITAQLYMMGRETRFLQELVLGVAGAKALSALGIQPSVYHMNEGHSALLLVERLREMTQKGSTWKQACALVKSQSVLTIHTPVPEGNERFDANLVRSVLEPLVAGTPIKVNDLLKLGRDSVDDPKTFDMTACALRLSRAANGVSILHGHTANKTWESVVGLPVGAITNGVHLPTWLGPEIRRLCEAEGAKFSPATALEVVPKQGGRNLWNDVSKISDRDLWEAHLRQKRALVEFANARLLRHHTRHGESPDQLRELTSFLDPEAFIIGFARRFAPYKRAGLLFTDPRRLLKMINAEGRSVQVIFSGKAHPGDRAGQDLIKDVYEHTLDPRFKKKVFVLEDYDMSTGRALVQGVDLWINNPLRPLEASGTSGMKAAANGVPNASILDGWWDEAYEIRPEGRNGFAVGERKNQKTRPLQDKFDANSLYKVLENEVLPLYWNRDSEGLARDWVRVMKQSIATSLYAFSTLRMIEDYASEMYI